jgi:cytochrome o ubiquinol oxidase subunit IV
MHEDSLSGIQKKWHGNYKGYLIGFILSMVLTAISFSLTMTLGLTGYALTLTLVALALVQAIVQLFYFLHLGQEAHPKWETLIFCFMVMILLIIAAGSLWIMYDLNERVMPEMVTTHEWPGSTSALPSARVSSYARRVQ